MTVIEAFVLGLVQGLTEFLPVSSSGHTIIAGKIMGLYQVPLAFELIIHLATLLAVIISMRKKVFSLIKKPLCKTTLLIITATIPTVLIFLMFESFFKSAFNGEYLIYCFLITAVLIIVSEFVSSSTKPKLKGKEMSVTDSIIIGLAQGVSALPGISRSGATITTSMLLSNSKEESLEFSFLLSIPIIIGSSAVELFANSSSIGVAFLPLIVGFITAFLSGLLSVTLIKRILIKHSLDGFAVYLFLLSVFLLVNDLFLHLF